jgi:hypothetical protein
VLSRRERYLYFSFTYCLGGSQFSYKWKIYWRWSFCINRFSNILKIWLLFSAKW